MSSKVGYAAPIALITLVKPLPFLSLQLFERYDSEREEGGKIGRQNQKIKSASILPKF